MTPSTPVTRFCALVLSGSHQWLGQPMDSSPVVCTSLLEVPGISFCHFHGLANLQRFVKSEIPFRQEALLNPSFRQATHKTCPLKSLHTHKILKGSVTQAHTM